MSYMRVLFFVFVSLLIFSCSKKRYAPNVENIKSDVVIVPFYQEVNSLKGEGRLAALNAISAKYPLFYKDFLQRVVGIDQKDSLYPIYITKFLDFPANREVFAECERQFGDGSILKADFDKAIKNYKFYFPKNKVDSIFLQMSGFSTFMMVDSGFVAVSLERYLGSSCKFYDLLGDPEYLQRKMVPEKIVPDAFKAIALVDFPNRDSSETVLSNMIYQGKVLHFVACMVPEIEDTLLFDYTPKELKWLDAHEEVAWATLIEKKHLYSTDYLTIQKYVGDAPFTSFFGQESPARVANYLGYRIVQEYLKKNPKVTLLELMNQNDAQLILRKSAYKP